MRKFANAHLIHQPATDNIPAAAVMSQLSRRFACTVGGQRPVGDTSVIRTSKDAEAQLMSPEEQKKLQALKRAKREVRTGELSKQSRCAQSLETLVIQMKAQTNPSACRTSPFADADSCITH